MRKFNLYGFLLLMVFFTVSCGGSGGGSGNGSGSTTSDTVTLTWTAPSENIDNSPLVDLQGYKVYYGDIPGTYDYSIDVGNVTTTTIQLNDPSISKGRPYYFVVRAYNQAGVESNFSNELSKMIN